MKKLFITFILLIASPAFAQETPSIAPLEKGQTILGLSAAEQMVLQQDLLQASLRIEVDGRDAKKVQSDINTAMAKALAASKDRREVKTRTGQYNVYSYDPNPNPQPQVKGAVHQNLWKGSQEIQLEGKDQAELLELAGKIQDMGFVMGGLNYTLSPEQFEIYKDRLMTAALKKLQVKAGLAAKALGKTNYDIIEVNVDNGGPVQPMPVMMKAARMEMDSAAMAAPVAQAGEQTIGLTVTARVLLKP